MMRRKLILGLFLILTNVVISQTSTTNNMNSIYLWPDKVPGETEPKHDPIQSDNTDGNVTRLTDVTNPALIVFEPDSKIKNGASIVICPGGGYNILAIDLEGYEIAKWLNALGYTAFVLQYRVPQKQEGALMDVQRAIRIVRSKSTSMGLDSNKIGVMGFSAGGSLSARASTNFMKQTYPKIDEIDQVSSKPNFALLIYPAYLDEGENGSLTPELTLANDTPPMFLFVTATDPYANSSLVMASALRDHNIPVEFHLYPKGDHGYGLRKGSIAAETWPILAEEWLRNLINN